MQLFKISFGPWEKLFEGMFEKKPVEIYSNPDSVIMVLIFEKLNSEIEGVVIELFKAYSVEGEIEGFIETLPREIVLLLKHDKRQTNKFLMLGSTPSYTEWKEEEFTGEIDALLKKLDNSAVILKDISKAYDINLVDISKSSLKVKKAFFAEPLLVPSLTSNYTAAGPKGEMPVIKGEFFVGLTRERQAIVEPLELFFTTLVTGGEKHERFHFLQILSEGFLLSNTSVLVFDSDNVFKGLNSPTTNTAELQRYKVPSDPIGFPTKIFRVNEQVKIDLNFITATGFSETFGIGKNPVTDIIATTLLKNTVENMDDLMEKVKLTPLNDEINEYEVRKAIRILRLISRSFSGLFEGKNDVESLVVSGTRNIGKAGVLDLRGLEPKLVFLVIHNLLSSILKFYRDSEKQGSRVAIVLPEINSILSKTVSPQMETEIEEIMKNLEKIGVGIVLSENEKIDTPPEIASLVEAKVNIISKNDVGIQLRGRKNYRVFLRPSLSVEIAPQQEQVM